MLNPVSTRLPGSCLLTVRARKQFNLRVAAKRLYEATVPDGIEPATLNRVAPRQDTQTWATAKRLVVVGSYPI